MTKEVSQEISAMCTYATAMENKGMSQDEKVTKEEALNMAGGILK